MAAFGNLIVVVILLNAITIGVQTYSIPGCWIPVSSGRRLSGAAIPYTVSFILIGTYIVINLVVGVVITSLDEAYKTRHRPKRPSTT